MKAHCSERERETEIERKSGRSCNIIGFRNKTFRNSYLVGIKDIKKKIHGAQRKRKEININLVTYDHLGGPLHFFSRTNNKLLGFRLTNTYMYYIRH